MLYKKIFSSSDFFVLNFFRVKMVQKSPLFLFSFQAINSSQKKRKRGKKRKKKERKAERTNRRKRKKKEWSERENREKIGGKRKFDS